VHSSGASAGFDHVAGPGGTTDGGNANAAGGIEVGGGGARAGAGNAGALSGGSANAGAPSVAGSGGAAALCTSGALRCDTVREHCDQNGAWVKESFVCATDITGATEQAIVCAVKSDGRMTCFGRSFDPLIAPLVAHAPDRKWAKLVLSDDPSDKTDHDLCGIDLSGSGVCWGIDQVAHGVGASLTQVAPGSQGLCVVGAEGTLSCPENDGIIGPITADSGPFQDLVMRNGFLFGLGRSGSVSVPFSQFSLPSGAYDQISASDRELCAVRADHELFCAPHAPPSALAAQRFLRVAVEYGGSMCAIRDDHAVVCDPLDGGQSFVPVAGEFTRLTATMLGMCAIRSDGSIACFGSIQLEPPTDW